MMKIITIITISILLWIALWICLISSIFSLYSINEKLDNIQSTNLDIIKKIDEWFIINIKEYD